MIVKTSWTFVSSSNRNATHLQQLLPKVGVEPAVQHGVAYARAHGQHVAHPQTEEIQLQQTGFYLVPLLVKHLFCVNMNIYNIHTCI